MNKTHTQDTLYLHSTVLILYISQLRKNNTQTYTTLFTKQIDNEKSNTV